MLQWRAKLKHFLILSSAGKPIYSRHGDDQLVMDVAPRGPTDIVFLNREGFDFPGASPYFEFPILSSFKPYTGGSPGADRVVFNSAGDYQGSITHTGASGNNFVACT